MDTIKQQLLSAYNAEIANWDGFYIEESQKALQEWENYSISESLLSELIQMDYTQFIKKSEDNSEVKIIKDKIFKLVAYCDAKANNKQLLNEYNDNRIIARAGIRQNAWVRQLLKYKIDAGSITPAIRNTINYIKDPAHNFPILSENHRDLISNYYLKHQYNADTFQDDLMHYFEELNISCLNEMNKTYLYTRMIYSMSSLWNATPQVKGLLARDSTDWKEGFFCDVQKDGCGVMWKDCLPTNFSLIKPQLKQLLEENEFFWFYFISSNRTEYRTRVIDFATAEEYHEVRDDWKAQKPSSFSYDFKDYQTDDQKQKAKIAFLCDEFLKIPTDQSVDISQFKTIGNASVKNPVAYTSLISNFELNMKKNISEHEYLLQNKKNIIYQGAPGTGKTYKTAELAVAICNPEFSEFGNRNAIMAEYNRLKTEGRIGFTTFHQSMDYEEFVEGLKPISRSNGITFEPRAGIFKELSDRALLNTISLSKNISTELEYDEIYDRLLEEITTHTVSSLSTKTDQQIVDFKITSQNNIQFKYKEGGKQYLVSRDRLRKVYVKYNNAAAVDAMRIDEIRDVIGGCHTSAYWAVLKYIVDNKSVSEEEVIDIDNLSDKEKESIIQAYINTPKANRVNNDKAKNYVLIIDEINRGNISKILGELITLLEPDKRIGEENELTAKLPYSQKEFGLPSNLFIVGTMNTADRSVGYIDYAIRRRFAFVAIKTDLTAVNNYYKNNESLKKCAVKLYSSVEKLITDKITPEFKVDDLMIGHSYFMANSEPSLQQKLDYEIKPLLREYANDGIINLSKNQKGEYDCIEELSITLL